MQVMDYHEAIFASKLSSHAKLVALAISSYYNWTKKQMCWPSNKTLSSCTSMSISTVVRAKKELVDRGFLEVQRRIDNSNLYRPLLPQTIGYVHTEQKVWSDSSTNNEVNNEVNNVDDSNESSVSIIIDLNQGEVDTSSFDTIWKVFEDDEREPRRAAPAGRSNGQPARSNIGLGRFNSNNATKPRIDQILDKAREW